MRKHIWLLYAGFLIFVGLIYFGTDVISSKQKTLEKSRVLVKQTKSIQLLMREAHHSIDPQQRSQIDELKVMLDRSTSDQERVSVLEQLAGSWYSFGNFAMSGYYAEEIAKIRNDDVAWSITGTTYSQGISGSENQRDKSYCAERARAAFDQAKLLKPDNLDVDLNMALTYVELPDEANPMKGIQLLLQLQRDYPEYAPVYRHLGRLGIRTGQYEKALVRLRKAWNLERDEGKVSCLLSQVFVELNQADSARFYKEICRN